MRDKILEIKPTKNVNNEWSKSNGCVYVIYKKNKPLFYNLDIDKANISRIIHLSTYMNRKKKGLLSVMLRDWNGRYNLYSPMTRKQMKEILNLGNTAFRSFLNNTMEIGLLYQCDGNFYLNTNYFTRDKNIKIKENEGMQKIYIKPIRLLCKNCDPRHDKTLSAVFQLIPFINYPTNILCLNSNSDDVVPINSNNIGKLIDIKANRNGNICRTINSFCDFTININKKTIRLFEIRKILDKECYHINESIMYNDYEEANESLYIDLKNIKSERKEILFLNDLEKVLKALRINGIRQYKVFNYRIDYYIPSLNIAIEYDENNHKNYTYEQHEGRQKKIEKELGCKFIRISDEFTNEENVLMVMDSIREICKL